MKEMRLKMRQLASIKEVKDIIPIEGKDRIELAIVLTRYEEEQ